MKSVDLLLIGDAYDGPSEELIEVTSLEQAFNIFGAYHYEEVAVTSGATGHTLSIAPWGNNIAAFRKDSDGEFVDKSLFEFSVSGSTLTWNSAGDASPDADPDAFSPVFSGAVTFRVLREPSNTSLITGIMAAMDTGASIYALRIGGTVAYSGTSGNVTFKALYPGSRYNNTLVRVSGGIVQMVPSAGTGRVRTYAPSSDVHLRELITRDIDRGYIKFYMDGYGSNTSLTVPSGTYTLSSGADGSLTAEALQAHLDNYDLDGVDVLCPVGLSTLQLSGVSIYDYTSEPYYPTLVVAQAPTSGAVLSGTINGHKNFCSVGFKVRYRLGSEIEYTGDAAPMVAGIVAANKFNITLAKLPEGIAEPAYDQTGLEAVTAKGHTLAYNSIAKGWALWHAVTGDPEWPVSTYRAYQDVVKILYLHLEPLLGETLLTPTILENEINFAFSQVTTGKVISWSLIRLADTLYAEVTFRPHGEIRTIKARIALGSPEEPTR